MDCPNCKRPMRYGLVAGALACNCSIVAVTEKKLPVPSEILIDREIVAENRRKFRNAISCGSSSVTVTFRLSSPPPNWFPTFVDDPKTDALNAVVDACKNLPKLDAQRVLKSAMVRLGLI